MSEREMRLSQRALHRLHREQFGDGRGATLASGYVNKAALNLAQAELRRGKKTGRIKGGLSMSPA